MRKMKRRFRKNCAGQDMENRRKEKKEKRIRRRKEGWRQIRKTCEGRGIEKSEE
jgi:hypothetical protein